MQALQLFRVPQRILGGTYNKSENLSLVGTNGHCRRNLLSPASFCYTFLNTQTDQLSLRWYSEHTSAQIGNGKNSFQQMWAIQQGHVSGSECDRIRDHSSKQGFWAFNKNTSELLRITLSKINRTVGSEQRFLQIARGRAATVALQHTFIGLIHSQLEIIKIKQKKVDYFFLLFL